jgi:peptidyl-prolyl cis-trans isomerase C
MRIMSPAGARAMTDIFVSRGTARRWATLGLALLTVVTVLVIATRKPSSLVLKYGEHVVTVQELDQFINTTRAVYGTSLPNLGNPDDMTRFRRNAGKCLAVDMAISDSAQERGINVTEATARESEARFIAQEIGDGPDARDKYIRALGDRGTSEDAVLHEIRQQLTSVLLWRDLYQNVVVSEQDVLQAFNDRQSDLREPERRRLLNIVLATKDEAIDVATKLKAGASFSTLAAQRSLDDATRESGGDLGEKSEAELQPAYGAAAFAAKKGDIFGPVETTSGWNVGKVSMTTPARAPAFQDVRGKLTDELETESANLLWRAWLGGRLRALDIDYAEEYTPTDPYDASSCQLGLHGAQGPQPR